MSGLPRPVAVKREHGLAAAGSAKMQGIGEVHALLRQIERLGEQGGVLHRNSRQTREGP